MTVLRCLPFFALVGCSSEKDDSAVADTGADTAEEPVERPESCTPIVKVDGTPVDELDGPRVGDVWTLLMYCDEVLQLGTYTLQGDPPDLITVDGTDPIVTFNAAGSVAIDYRVGSRRADFSVTIQD